LWGSLETGRRPNGGVTNPAQDAILAHNKEVTRCEF
jgi:hypothetical protein